MDKFAKDCPRLIPMNFMGYLNFRQVLERVCSGTGLLELQAFRIISHLRSYEYCCDRGRSHSAEKRQRTATLQDAVTPAQVPADSWPILAHLFFGFTVVVMLGSGCASAP